MLGIVEWRDLNVISNSKIFHLQPAASVEKAVVAKHLFWVEMIKSCLLMKLEGSNWKPLYDQSLEQKGITFPNTSVKFSVTVNQYFKTFK